MHRGCHDDDTASFGSLTAPVQLYPFQDGRLNEAIILFFSLHLAWIPLCTRVTEHGHNVHGVLGVGGFSGLWVEYFK
jgi:hypothetical protein